MRSREVDFALYIGQRRSALRDDDPALKNLIQERDYSWIWNRFAWEFGQRPLESVIRVTAEDFITESDIRIRQRIDKKRDEGIAERQRKSRSELGHPMPEEGQYIAAKKSADSRKLYLIKVITISYDPVHDLFKMNGANLGKFLAPGKVEAYDIRRRDIFAIFQREKLPSTLAMYVQVMKRIEQNEPFEGLIWRRP